MTVSLPVLIRSMTRSILVGIFLIIATTGGYAYAQSFMSYITPERVMVFQALAYLYFVVLFSALVLIMLGLNRLLESKKAEVANLSEIRFALGSLIPYLFLKKKFARTFFVSTILYGLFYSFITSIIVYQPTINFSEAYLAKIPSVIVIPAYGPPGQIPVLVVYLSEHLGLLIMPLSVILLLTVSILVGLNFSLAYFAYESRHKGTHRGWMATLGAAVGLFTGCPACAGLFLASMVGGAGATAMATVLAPFQSLFIGISIPILLAAPFLISRNIARAFSGGCIIRHPTVLGR